MFPPPYFPGPSGAGNVPQMHSGGGHGPLPHVMGMSGSDGFGPPPDRGGSNPRGFIDGRPVFKGRLCPQFSRGQNCLYGTNCKFAHGEQELRGADPDRRPAVAVGAAGGGTGPDNTFGASAAGFTRKTQLCTKFMATGTCNYANCKFAHGYEELRPPGADGPTSQHEHSFGPAHMPPPQPPHQLPLQQQHGQIQQHNMMQQQGGSMGNVMRPGALPGPPGAGAGPGAGGMEQFASAMTAGRGPISSMPPPPSVGVVHPGPRAPAPATHLSSTAGPATTAVAPAAPPTTASLKEVTFVERVRAVCGILNIGNAAALSREKPAALQAAVTAIRSNTAFRANPFADDAEGYLQN